MTLQDYMQKYDLRAKEVAALLLVSDVSVRRYIRGERMPCEAVMRRIHALTRDAVTANDFHNQREAIHGKTIKRQRKG